MIELHYVGKKPTAEILALPPCRLRGEWNHARDKLIRGDNLHILKALLDGYSLHSKIDLVYIDPPFATRQNFTLGEDRVSTISKSSSDKAAYSDTLTGSAFLEFLRERLIMIRELMAAHASIYLHIDTKIGHSIKIIMDEIFGAENFRNDITRIKCNPKNFSRKGYGNIKDMILFYSKSKEIIWNEPKDDLTDGSIERLFRKVDENGRRYTTVPLHAPGETQNGATGAAWRDMQPPTGRHWRSEPKILEELDRQGLIEWSKNGVPRKKIYADEKAGKKKQDIWEYKDPQYPTYPTEKNLEMLKTILQASSNPGDWVLDCFCGSGAALQAAEEMGRNWIGVDKSMEAIQVTRERLSKIRKDSVSGKPAYDYLEEVL